MSELYITEVIPTFTHVIILGELHRQEKLGSHFLKTQLPIASLVNLHDFSSLWEGLNNMWYTCLKDQDSSLLEILHDNRYINLLKFVANRY